MSKDQKSMGRRNVIRRGSACDRPSTPSHYKRLSTANKVAFVHPLGDVTQA